MAEEPGEWPATANSEACDTAEAEETDATFTWSSALEEDAAEAPPNAGRGGGVGNKARVHECVK